MRTNKLKRHIRGIEGFEGELTPKIIDIVKGIKSVLIMPENYIKDETVFTGQTQNDRFWKIVIFEQVLNKDSIETKNKLKELILKANN
jgi:hypothetical protein